MIGKIMNDALLSNVIDALNDGILSYADIAARYDITVDDVARIADASIRLGRLYLGDPVDGD
jgi:uncharacterized protein YdbL (DUF1318 family)